jgi:sugar-phosphatase
MDGLLIDSEPLWQSAEIEEFGRVGLSLTHADCALTVGLRIDEVAAIRHAQRPWPEPTVATVAERIVERVIALVPREGQPKPGVAEAVAFVRARGVRIGLASSSPGALIVATLAHLGIADAFEAWCSAEDEPFGKPHPGVYLTLAARLGVAAGACLAIEDSCNGLISAKAARMRCLVVPDGPFAGDPRLALADAVLPSLTLLDDTVWSALSR